jgi:hypothetical protein
VKILIFITTEEMVVRMWLKLSIEIPPFKYDSHDCKGGSRMCQEVMCQTENISIQLELVNLLDFAGPFNV